MLKQHDIWPLETPSKYVLSVGPYHSLTTSSQFDNTRYHIFHHNFSGQDPRQTHTYTVNYQQILESIGLYIQNRGVVILGIKKDAHEQAASHTQRLGWHHSVNVKQEKVSHSFGCLGSLSAKSLGFLEAQFETCAKQKNCCLLHSSLVLCQGRHI